MLVCKMKIENIKKGMLDMGINKIITIECNMAIKGSQLYLQL